MASKRYAKRRARTKSRQVFRQNIKKPKRSVVKKFANFVGKTTYKIAKLGKTKRKKRMSYGRKRTKR